MKALPKKQQSASSQALENRSNPAYLHEVAVQLAANTSIQQILWRQRDTAVDFYFISKNKQKAYKEAAPIVRRLLDESVLPLDFHFATPNQAQTE